MLKAISTENYQTVSKGQKILAALLLVTDHLSDTDPLRMRIRTLALGLIDRGSGDAVTCATTIQSILVSATLAKVINEKNASILQTELQQFVVAVHGDTGIVAKIFPEPEEYKGHSIGKRTPIHDMSISFIKGQNISNRTSQLPEESINKSKENKAIRHERILSYINNRKSANIKDISALFPDVSEKTIQRELGGLVSSGKITKRGDKRWSLYLAVS